MLVSPAIYWYSPDKAVPHAPVQIATIPMWNQAFVYISSLMGNYTYKQLLHAQFLGPAPPP